MRWSGCGLLLVLMAAGCTERPTARSTDSAVTRVASPAAGSTELFVDVAAPSGLDFVHFNGMSGEFYICEVKCAGGGLFDYDNDGDLDVYLLQGTMLGEGKTPADAKFPPPDNRPLSDRLYRNDLIVAPDGTRQLHFTDVTESAGIVDQEFGIGMATGDYDNDGWLDLYVSNFGPNRMYHNNRDGTFTDVTSQTGTQDARYNASAAFVDIDRDGWLDLFVTAYVNFSYATHKKCFMGSGRQDYCGPLAFNALPDRLYRNRGDGTFEDISAKSQIVQEYGSGLGVVCADLNGDGWTDMYVANDARPNQLWINQHDGTFRNESLLRGCAVNRDGMATSCMGIDAGDFDADGDDDLFMTNLRNETNTLFLNDGTGMFDDRTAETSLGMPSMPYTSFGTAWFDYDNDGWLDIFIANGEVQMIDALVRAGDPFPYHQRNQLFRNLGDGRFREMSEEAGAAMQLSEVSRGAAFGDVDNDGDTDILITNNSGPARLLLNQVGNRNHWIGLRHGRRAPRAAICWARALPCTARPVRRFGEPCAPRTAIARPTIPACWSAWATRPEITKVCAYWPDGSAEQWTAVPVDQYTVLRQGSGARRSSW